MNVGGGLMWRMMMGFDISVPLCAAVATAVAAVDLRILQFRRMPSSSLQQYTLYMLCVQNYVLGVF